MMLTTEDLVEEQELDSLATLKLLTRNTRLVATRQDKGLTQWEASHQVGIGVSRYQEIEKLRRLPTFEDEEKIASFFQLSIDYLFPKVLLEAIEAGVFDRRHVQLAASELISLTEAQKLRLSYDGETVLIEEIRQRELKEKIEQVLQTLKPREQRILQLRFGLEDGRSRTLEEVGAVFDLTRERTRQIEAKALRLLRHPTRSRPLKDYLE